MAARAPVAAEISRIVAVCDSRVHEVLQELKFLLGRRQMRRPEGMQGKDEDSQRL